VAQRFQVALLCLVSLMLDNSLDALKSKSGSLEFRWRLLTYHDHLDV
jgi:hypothetical protein